MSASGRLSSVLLDHVAADWPEFAALRAAVSAAGRKSRLPAAVSIAINELRVAIAADFLTRADRPRGPMGGSEQADSRALAERLVAHAVQS